MNELKTDYLIVGAGAMGMAFADTILHETDANIIIVDINDKPGGHWNHAYPFVRLHQPSAYYGVNSRPLGSNHIDKIGPNAGMHELASSPEILAYFDQVMRQDFLESGRVKYFPQTEYIGDEAIRCILSGKLTHIRANKLVDSTYMDVKVPAIDDPKFEFSSDINCIPPNGLAHLKETPDKYVVIGGGKTGVDTCLYLLGLGVSEQNIDWIVPRDSWFLDRENVQPAIEGNPSVLDSFLMQINAIAESNSLDDMFDRVSACGGLLRLDEQITPQMYKCATISKAELGELKRIKNIIRKGRIQRIEKNHIFLDEGELKTPDKTVYINCTSDGLEKRPLRPIFEDNRITLQAVRPCQQLFSAALIAHTEAVYEDDQKKNHICEPVQHPDSELDYLISTASILTAQMRWSADPELLNWLANARLDGITTPEFATMMQHASTPEGQALLAPVMTALTKMSSYLGQEAAS